MSLTAPALDHYTIHVGIDQVQYRLQQLDEHEDFPGRRHVPLSVAAPTPYARIHPLLARSEPFRHDLSGLSDERGVARAVGGEEPVADGRAGWAARDPGDADVVAPGSRQFLSPFVELSRLRPVTSKEAEARYAIKPCLRR